MPQWVLEGGGTYNARILLAEDDPVNQIVARSILAKFGYQVDVVSNGKEALEALENKDYSLILMDCMMPVMGGFETTAIIRDPASEIRNHSIPIIALTASAMRDDQAKCLAAGMDDYLAKPLEFAELLAMLETWLPPSNTLGTNVDPEFDSAYPMALGTGTGSDSKSCVSLIEIFNRDEFVRRNLGDLDLSRDVALIFIDSAPEYIESISKAVAAHDAAALRQSAHKLNGAAANLALPLLSEKAGMIESHAEARDLEKAGQLLPELELQFERAVDALTKALIAPQGVVHQ